MPRHARSAPASRERPLDARRIAHEDILHDVFGVGAFAGRVVGARHCVH